MPTLHSLTPTDAPPARALGRLLAGRAAAWLLAAVVFASVLPTLGWTQFHHSIENFNVATALELRRGGPWLVPTLQGIPRLAKPPLTAWLTAAALRPDTLRNLDSPDPAVRALAYQWLAVEARWPTLLALCLLLVATYELGRAVAGGRHEGGGAAAHRVGLTAAAAAATTFFFVRHAHFATTDVHLALWVGLANAALAASVFGRRYWRSLPLAGVALGFALMAKGPVSLVQTVVPVGLFLLVRARPKSTRVEAGEEDHGIPAVRKPAMLAPALAGLVLMLLVGGAWFVAVAATHDHVWSLWRAEVTRVDADEVPAGAWYAHAANLVHFGPWLIWAVVGAAFACRQWAGRTGHLRSRDREGAGQSNEPALATGIASLSTAGPSGRSLDRATSAAPLPDGRGSSNASPETSAQIATGSPPDALGPRPNRTPARPEEPIGGPALALLLVLVPLVVMSFAKDRFDRYLLPLVPAGAVLAALGLEVLRTATPGRERGVRLALLAHWLVVAGWAVGQPLLAATGWVPALRTVAGGPWFSWPLALALVAVPAAALAWGVRAQRRWPAAVAAATFVAITAGQVGYTLGRSRSPAGEADLRVAAEALRADPRLAGVAVVAKDEPKKNKINIHANTLSIYLNRTAQWAADPAALSANHAGPVAWVLGRGRSAPDPPVPAGWEVFFKKGGADKKFVLLHRPRTN
jgi:hypothetical protein